VNLTAEENIRLHALLYGLYPYRPAYRLMPPEYRRQVAELAGLLDLDREIFEPIRTFSGGMQRKLEIVRSLMHRPRVLFLDEPTAGLDAPTRRTLWDHLSMVRREHSTTIFLTTHYLEEAEQADRICIIDHGRVVAMAPPSELKAELAREYLVVDATDRSKLARELGALGLAPEWSGPFRLQIDGRRTHEILKSIETPLTLVQTHAPTLEDAYLEIVGRRADGEEGTE
jgi:ABC-2 type transport system ATP-binding protein